MLLIVGITAGVALIVSGGNVAVAGLCAGAAAAIVMSRNSSTRLKTGPQH